MRLAKVHAVEQNEDDVRPVRFWFTVNCDRDSRYGVAHVWTSVVHVSAIDDRLNRFYRKVIG